MQATVKVLHNYFNKLHDSHIVLNQSDSKGYIKYNLNKLFFRSFTFFRFLFGLFLEISFQ